LDQQIANNGELDKKIEQADRLVSKFKSEQQEAAESYQSFQDEVELVRNTLNKGK
jgi:hypothetical protein